MKGKSYDEKYVDSSGESVCFYHPQCISFWRAIQIVTEDYPPYNYEVNGELTGFSTEVVKLIVQNLGMQAQPKLLP